ncbi:MAG: hypothetical protein A2284_07125 [Deltaproteobacteria bacterium RIFOXYA12_FULL_61_11]|nr:MAG: hypothetical protein A2284_07125 [Deltaproteobacteria bacterium RIFOXYA12_FULL_61_11]
MRRNRRFLAGAAVLGLGVVLGFILVRPGVPPEAEVPAGVPGLCDGEPDSLARDLCFFSSYANAAASSDVNPCPGIVDPYLGRLCDRLTWRPHMREFLTRRGKTREPSGSFSCPGRVPPDGLLCRYLEAAAASAAIHGEAADVCTAAPTEEQRDECRYYQVLAWSIRLKDEAMARAAIETLCEQMRTPEYRSECWYTLADELAQAEASPDPATLVELCARSTMARNYHCQDHVLYFLHSEEVARAFCSLTVRARDREGCFARMGQGFSVRAGGAFSAAKARCAQFLPRSAADACVEGAAFSFGMGLTGEERFARCAELGGRASRACTRGLAEALDQTGALPEACRDFPAWQQVVCVELFLDNHLEHLVAEPGEALAFCQEQSELHAFCLERLVRALVEAYPDRKVRAERCTRLPRPADHACLADE